jgi:hypothetical protein
LRSTWRNSLSVCSSMSRSQIGTTNGRWERDGAYCDRRIAYDERRRVLRLADRHARGGRGRASRPPDRRVHAVELQAAVKVTEAGARRIAYEIRPADLGDRLHNQHPNLSSQITFGSTVDQRLGGVPFASRSTPKQGPYFTPNHIQLLLNSPPLSQIKNNNI